ncbi:hypothetical protein ACVW0J_003012 [Bradyrhizobium sp. i1.7.7]
MVRSPAQRASRTRCSTPTSAITAPVTVFSGATIHAISANALNPIIAPSKRPNGTGRRPGLNLTSQLRVKLGMMRPPISEISSTTTPMPTRMLTSAAPSKCASRWKATLPASSTSTSTTTGRLRQLPPAMISRVAAATTNARKAASTTSANAQPISADRVTAKRPASHTVSSAPSDVPWIGSRPVQFGIAVNRNPVITAGRKP